MRPSIRRWRAAAAWLVGLAAGCGTPPPATPPVPPSAPAAPPVAAPRPAAPAPTGPAPIVRARARWVPAAWADLPGWPQDRARDLWPALVAGCAKPADGWAALCTRVLATPAPADDDTARAFLQRHLQPYRVEALDGATQGLATGYFEPLVDASRVSRWPFRTALHRPPPDLEQRKPYWTRKELDTLPTARAALRGQEIAYVGHPLDALLLQVQGSGRLRVKERDGRVQVVRLAYAAHNDQPYKSVGRWLIEQGEMTPDEASWPAIRDWARRHPRRLNQLLWSNPRVVFFREEALPDPTLGPRGAQGVPLTAGRSVAVDPQAVPYGSMLWLDTTEPMSGTPLRRLVMAQDTGSAIVGAVRVDYFWGSGEQAEQQAGRMKQPLRVWALWPR